MKKKENLPRKLLQVLMGRETSVAAYVDVNMENDYFWFDLSQTNEKIKHGNGLEHGFSSCMEIIVLKTSVELTGSFTKKNVCK